MTRIEELLEQRHALVQTAALLYGDMYVTNDQFWKSSIEKDMFAIEEELDDLGHVEEGITPEMEFAAQLIFDLLKSNGTIPDEREDEEDAQ